VALADLPASPCERPNTEPITLGFAGSAGGQGTC